MDKAWLHGYQPYILEDQVGEGRILECLDRLLGPLFLDKTVASKCCLGLA